MVLVILDLDGVIVQYDDHCTLYPDARKCIEYLYDEGNTLAIASFNDSVARILRQHALSLYFSDIHSADMKSKRLMVQAIIAKFPDEQHVVYFDDNMHNVTECETIHGCQCIYVDTKDGLSMQHLLMADLWPPRYGLYSPTKGKHT